MEEESKVALTRSRGNKRSVNYNFFQSQGFSFEKMGSAPFHFPREKPLIFAAIVLQVVASTDVTVSAATSARRSISDVFGSSFLICSICNERFYYFIHTVVGFAEFVFWGFHFRALHEFPIFTTLYLFSLSFSPGSFSIHNVFPPQKPQKPDASVEESTTVLKRVFVVSVSSMLKSFFGDAKKISNKFYHGHLP